SWQMAKEHPALFYEPIHALGSSSPAAKVLYY
ncbi:MAG: hypothetical protein ACI8PG_004390, partial [Planctomycetota bacterium]